MDAYEIRLELLKLAQSIEADKVWVTRNQLEQNWNAARSYNEMKNEPAPPFPNHPVVTHEDVIRVAEELNKFVSNKG